MSTINPLVYDAANARLAEQPVIIPPGYIDGLNLIWNSGTSISVSSGSAYIESLGAVVNVPAALTLSSLSLTASTWYHVYLYLDAGSPAIECVATPPETAYSGAARSKTGDASHRYLGSISTDGSGALFMFFDDGDAIYYVDGLEHRPLYLGSSTTVVAVSLSQFVPDTSAMINAAMTNTGTAAARYSPTGFGYVAQQRMYGLTAGAYVVGIIPVGESRSFDYHVVSGGLATLDVLGYSKTR